MKQNWIQRMAVFKRRYARAHLFICSETGLLRYCRQ